jgi:hypothetical protein
MESVTLSTNTSLGGDEAISQLPIRPDIAQVGPTSKRQPLTRLGAVTTGIILSVMSTSCTTIAPPPWLLGRFRDGSSVYGLYPAKQYRRISLSEARTLALQALLQAEAERIEVADWEARTAYEWFVV